ncbi:MAG: aminoacyl-tRNA hydrolase [Pseudomonadota bacterium]
MSDSKIKIIAGLGNPGENYAQTRHNIGFLVVEALASKSHLTFDKTRFNSQYAKGRIHNQDVFLLKPMTYMNLSGLSIYKFASFYKVVVDDIVIVHDDMDLEFGKIKIVKSRGHGGHNGVRSIIGTFGQKDFIRVRMGVGHPGNSKNVTGHVLGNFAPDEVMIVDQLVDTASNACFSILENGPGAAMNSFNTK